MKNHIPGKLIALALIAIVPFLSSCSDNSTNPPDSLPSNYNFTNVNHKEQTALLLLGDSLVKLMKGLDDAGAKSITKAELEAIFDNTAGLFSDIEEGVSLSAELSGAVNPNIVSEIRAYFDSLATRSALYAGDAKATTTEDNIYIPEVIEKHLMGGLYYWHALNDMFEEIPTADNNVVTEGKGTAMQHEWDESFGYFGITQYFKDLTTLADRRGGKDVNGDGKLDPETERNFFHARYAVGRDNDYQVYTSTIRNFADSIYAAFIDGREAIGKKDYIRRDADAAKISRLWDEVIAACAIKYAVDIKAKITDIAGIRVAWTELKGFVTMTQYNKDTKLSTSLYNQVNGLIGEKPTDVTVEGLDQVINTLKTAYGF